MIHAGDTVRVDVAKVRAYDNTPPYIKLVRQAIHHADGNRPYIASIDEQYAYIRAWEFDLLGDVRVPVEAITA